MNTKDDAHNFQGGPAFPSVEMQDAVRIFPGMTLRDAFAAMIVQGLATRAVETDAHWDQAVSIAYKAADKMLKERLR